MMLTSTIVTVIIVIYLIVFLAMGWRRGFFRMILTTMSLIVTLVVSAFLVSPVTEWLIENTEVEKSVEKAVSNALGWGETSGDETADPGKSSENNSADSDNGNDSDSGKNASANSSSESNTDSGSSENKKNVWEQIKEAADEMAEDLGIYGGISGQSSDGTSNQSSDGTSDQSTASTSDQPGSSPSAAEHPETVASWQENETVLENAGLSENKVIEKSALTEKGFKSESNKSEMKGDLVEEETFLIKEGYGSEAETTINYDEYINAANEAYESGNFSSWEDVEATFGIDSDQLNQIEDEAIDSLSLPSFLKDLLSSNNTPEEYVKLGVSNFQEYIVKSISILVLKILVYIALVIAILIIIRILLLVTKAISRVPVISGVNKFFGALLGLLQGLIYLWLLCLLISAISQTPFGQQIINVINGSALLTAIYDHNLISAFLNGLFS